jgi:ubiquitin C-terminal hydrolase
LLALLGLHEDCNRVLVKPATEQVEADETASEVETAAEAWRRHLLRNQSFIVDAFQVGVALVLSLRACVSWSTQWQRHAPSLC